MAYVPILKSKQGEFIALRELKAETKKYVTPLIEIIPIQFDYAKSIPKKSLKNHVTDVLNNLKKIWSEQLPIYLDTSLLNEGKEGVSEVYDQLKELNLNYIPVVTVEENLKYSVLFKDIILQKANGFCLRLSSSHITNPNFKFDVLNIINQYKINISEVDLLLDLGDISKAQQDQINLYEFALRMLIGMLEIFNDFRKVIFVSGSFPADLSDISSGSKKLLPREEWKLYKKIINYPNAKNFIYGDYGTNNKAIIEGDPRMMRIGAAIRYTVDDFILVLKGYAINNPYYDGFGQFHELSSIIRNSEYFTGSSFSWGDNYIFFCSQRLNSSGNKSTWVAISTNHHIEFVAHQLSNFDASL
ncbi:beta family protein [soil metagenome]